MSFAKPEKTTSSANVVTRKLVMRYQCAAHQCPMHGAVSVDGGRGVCTYHYSTHGAYWPCITQTLLDWSILRHEIEHCRSLHCDPGYSVSPDVLEREYSLAVQRVMLGAGTWADELKPGVSRCGQPQSYQTWGRRLERFLNQRVAECLRRRIGKRTA